MKLDNTEIGGLVSKMTSGKLDQHPPESSLLKLKGAFSVSVTQLLSGIGVQ